MDLAEILGGFLFLGMVTLLSVFLLGDMEHRVRKIEDVLNKEDKYVN